LWGRVIIYVADAKKNGLRKLISGNSTAFNLEGLYPQ
jgi:hypothetical protein